MNINGRPLSQEGIDRQHFLTIHERRRYDLCNGVETRYYGEYETPLFWPIIKQTCVLRSFWDLRLDLWVRSYLRVVLYGGSITDLYIGFISVNYWTQMELIDYISVEILCWGIVNLRERQQQRICHFICIQKARLWDALTYDERSGQWHYCLVQLVMMNC